MQANPGKVDTPTAPKGDPNIEEVHTGNLPHHVWSNANCGHAMTCNNGGIPVTTPPTQHDTGKA